MKNIIIITLIATFCIANEPITPIPQTLNYNKKKALLGKKLFFDPVLSKNNSISCASCHNIYTNGADNLSFSQGFNGIKDIINTPTVFNSVFNFKQFWNGRAKDLKVQAKNALYNPIEHNMNKKLIETKLNQNSKYKQLFQEVYGTNTISENEVFVP
ncbi:cytochrome-c peroxidase [Sulfurimonas sp.]